MPRCPCCPETALVIFHRVDDVPVQSCLLLDSAEAARAVPRGRIDLGRCPRCGLIFNASFDPATQAPVGRSEVTQGFSSSFSAFVRDLARDLIERYDVRGKRVVEIGCGAGEFLAAMCVLGDNRGVGIDPATEPHRIPAEAAARITVIRERWSEAHGRIEPDAICCRHTLEHVADPLAFVRSIRRGLEGRPEALVVFEVPDTTRVLETAAFWDIYYEHCGYYTPASLRGLFERAGFEVLEVERIFHDQYLLIAARPAAGAAGAAGGGGEAVRGAEAVSGLVDRFQRTCGQRLAEWRECLAQLRRPLVLWGSGSKAVGFLTTLRLEREIEVLVDVNPYRSGRHSPGTGHMIVAPDDLRQHEPRTVIIMNPAYRAEIAGQLADLGLHPAVLTT